MAAAATIQDMPPLGGYAPLNFKRVPARTYFRGWHLFAGFLAIKCTAIYFYYKDHMMITYRKIENRSARLAIQPLLEAERDRGLLKQMLWNREEEEKLMANVPGWVVGHYYSEPIFKTVPKDVWIKPLAPDFFAHSHFDAYVDRAHFHHYHC